MKKIKIKLISLGLLPFKFDKEGIENWTSDVFELTDKIETHKINQKPAGQSHEYLDSQLLKDMPKHDNCDFMIAMTNVPLENNWYSRRLADNTVCFSFFELADVLRSNNIPLENLLYRLLYSYTLIFKRFGNRLPSMTESTNFIHSDTRKCLFDFNGIKSEIIFSTVKPIICDECTARLQQEKVSKETIDQIKKELKRINKLFYYRLTDFFNERPFVAITLSIGGSLALGIIGSIIYDFWLKGLLN